LEEDDGQEGRETIFSSVSQPKKVESLNDSPSHQSDVEVHSSHNLSNVNVEVKPSHTVSQDKVEPVQMPSSQSPTELQLTELLLQQSAPEIKLETFFGDPLTFRYFITSFFQHAEAKVKDPVGRLQRLIQATAGQPRLMISTLIYDQANGYSRALPLLQEEFGSNHAVVAAYNRQLEVYKPVPANDGEGLFEFYVFLLKISNSLDSTEFRCECWTLRKIFVRL
jgi:hypothetical protein